SLTKNIRYRKISCSDINTAALRLAKRNAEFHDVKEKIDFICSDLFSAVTSGSLKFELIIANPPYVCTRDIRKLPVDVQREPKNALDGGYDGLEFYRKIVEQIPDFIANSGYLAFEFGDGQKVLIKDIIKESGIFEEPVFFCDFNGIFRFVIAKCKNG
ncbi:MAG: methyltransferase, partial [Candidatus Omnitrophica bacterium]|nr:methyltransferase [Candidatus Omnitrophota bacterium]